MKSLNHTMRGVLEYGTFEHYTKTERFAVIKEAVRDLKEYRNYKLTQNEHI